MTRVHLIEPGGRGGVYHHTVAVAVALAGAGVEARVCTAADAERVPAAVKTSSCLWRVGWLRPRTVRRAALVLGWLLAGIPACVGRLRAGDVVHLQGWFRPALFLPLALACRLRGCVLAFSPHNTFARDRHRIDERLVRWLARGADVVFAFSEHDRVRLQAWGASAVTAPLAVVAPPPRPELVSALRRRWLGSHAQHAVLVAGRIREDKGLDRAIEAAAGWGRQHVLVVVGEDAGALAASRELADRLGAPVVWDVGYQPLERFVAAIAAADVVACPYRRASQSAVLALAQALGRPSVATAVGGLPELATVVVPPEDAAALAEGVRRALRAATATSPGSDLAGPYLDAYAHATVARGRPR